MESNVYHTVQTIQCHLHKMHTALSWTKVNFLREKYAAATLNELYWSYPRKQSSITT